ncbi:hypothetical protein CDV36_008080 [Fusarium kuroshium]|uniref:Uncharacterized protein n=1 Tax=Fusarium kuroshium TaxID=2010991 RepID=A0A3M2S500_9HYPO|nr:hypothetical protein CDV36_008080 [Fusarium kuroshium]
MAYRQQLPSPQYRHGRFRVRTIFSLALAVRHLVARQIINYFTGKAHAAARQNDQPSSLARDSPPTPNQIHHTPSANQLAFLTSLRLFNISTTRPIIVASIVLIISIGRFVVRVSSERAEASYVSRSSTVHPRLVCICRFPASQKLPHLCHGLKFKRGTPTRHCCLFLETKQLSSQCYLSSLLAVSSAAILFSCLNGVAYFSRGCVNRRISHYRQYPATTSARICCGRPSERPLLPHFSLPPHTRMPNHLGAPSPRSVATRAS